ncbi:MAG: hypothetical protein VW378_03670 [bacterium]
MIKTIQKYIIFLLTLTLTTSIAFAGWDTSSWIYNNGTPGAGTVANDSEVIEVTAYIEEVSTLELKPSTAFHGDDSGNTFTPSVALGVLALDSETNHPYAMIEIHNNNPVGYSIKVESAGNCKLKRKYFDGSAWQEWATNSDTDANFAAGNEIAYTISTEILVTGANTGGSHTAASGSYDGSNATAHDSTMSAIHKEGGANKHNLEDMSAGSAGSHTFSYVDGTGTVNIKHGTYGKRITFFMHATPTKANLRGLYSDTITFTLIDGA